jgi:hypothetical protein
LATREVTNMAMTQDMRVEARQTGRVVSLRVAADAVVFLGAMVAVRADGFAVPAADAAGMAVIGVAQEHVSNAGGGDGAARVRVQKGVFGIPNSATAAIEQAGIGRPALVEDDGTVAATASAGVIAGVVDEIDGDRVYVYFA